MKPSPLLLAALAGCAAAPSSAGGSIEGRVVGPEWPLAHAFVWVKSGAPPSPAPREPVVLDQRGYEFVPRVFGLRVGQELRITSADYTIHNVKCAPFHNPEFNVTMLQDDVVTRVFTKPETMVLLECNYHSHMKAYAGVLDHSFFAVTGRDGTFRIEGLPAGTYTLAAWCEDRGIREAAVTVGPGASPVTFRFP